MVISPELDPAAIFALFSHDSGWARSCGALVRSRRRELKLTVGDLAQLCAVREGTIYRIESGSMVASDRLRAIIAYHLEASPETLWPYPSRADLKSASKDARRLQREAGAQ